MRILRRDEVTKKIGLERSAIYQMMAEGTFPRQVRLGPMSVGWLESEVDEWIADRAAAREEKPAAPARRRAAGEVR